MKNACAADSEMAQQAGKQQPVPFQFMYLGLRPIKQIYTDVNKCFSSCIPYIYMFVVDVLL